MIIHMILQITLNINLHAIIHMDIHKEILGLLKKERVLSNSDVARHFNISWNTAEKYLLELALEGKIERIRKEKKTLWLPLRHES